jgi:hypothetical protein
MAFVRILKLWGLGFIPFLHFCITFYCRWIIFIFSLQSIEGILNLYFVFCTDFLNAAFISRSNAEDQFWENVSWHIQSCIHLKGIWTHMLVEPCYKWFMIQEFSTVWQLEDMYANPLWPEARFMCTMFQAPNSGQLTMRN